MEFILEKILEKAMIESYSPEQVKQILDAHQEMILTLTKNIPIMFSILSIAIGYLAIRMEIGFFRTKKKTKNLKKTLDEMKNDR